MTRHFIFQAIRVTVRTAHDEFTGRDLDEFDLRLALRAIGRWLGRILTLSNGGQSHQESDVD
jgi:hypothetical protein